MNAEESARLKEFAEIAYGSVVDLARALKKSNNFFSPYLSEKGSSIGWKLAKQLYDAGLSINWLMSGNGSMYSESKTGQLLKQKHIPLLSADEFQRKNSALDTSDTINLKKEIKESQKHLHNALRLLEKAR